MGKQTVSIAMVFTMLALLLAGCGLIGGPFDEPSPDEGQSAAKTPAPAELTETFAPGESTAEPTLSAAALLPADCKDALTVTRDEVGEKKCVGGIVYRVSQEHGTFYVDFSKKTASFFMVGLDWDSPFVVRAGDCIYAQGKIDETNRVLSMVIDRYSLKKCLLSPTP